MEPLFNLVYLSKSRLGDNEQTIVEGVKNILDAANKNNPAMGITGALLYSGGYFCQVIEGNADALEELFEVIQLDDRHGDITVLQFAPIKQRDFSEWSMAFAGFQSAPATQIEGVLESKDTIRMRETGRNLVSMMDKLVNQHQSVSD